MVTYSEMSIVCMSLKKNIYFKIFFFLIFFGLLVSAINVNICIWCYMATLFATLYSSSDSCKSVTARPYR